MKDAWQKGDVAVELFLDIKSAFPTVNHEMLEHDMRMRRVPMEITRWIREKLTNRTVRLAFDNHITEQLRLPTGIDQGCPLSPISYTFYNTDLVHSDRNRNTLKLSFHDDTVFLARAKTFEATNKELTRMMTDSDGALEWAKSHQSAFEIDKTALICFTRCQNMSGAQIGMTNTAKGVPLTIEGRTILPQRTTRYLGVILDSELCFRENIALATAKGAKWTQALKRMSRGIKGIPPHLVRRLYICAAIPSKMRWTS